MSAKKTMRPLPPVVMSELQADDTPASPHTEFARRVHRNDSLAANRREVAAFTSKVAQHSLLNEVAEEPVLSPQQIEEELAFVSRVKGGESGLTPRTHVEDELDVRHSLLDSVSESEDDPEDLDAMPSLRTIVGEDGAQLKEASYARRVKRNDSLAARRDQVSSARGSLAQPHHQLELVDEAEERDLTYASRVQPDAQPDGARRHENISVVHSLLDPVREMSQEEPMSPSVFARRVIRNDSMAAQRSAVAAKRGTQLGTMLGNTAEAEDEAESSEEEEESQATNSAGLTDTSDLEFARRVKRSDSLAPRRGKVAASTADMKSGSLLTSMGEEDEDEEEEDSRVNPRLAALAGDSAGGALSPRTLEAERSESGEYARRVKRSDSLAGQRSKVAATASKLARSSLNEDIAEDDESDSSGAEEAIAANSAGQDRDDGAPVRPRSASSEFARRVKRSDSLAAQRQKVSESAVVGHSMLGELDEGEEEEEEGDFEEQAGGEHAVSAAPVQGMTKDVEFARRVRRNDSLSQHRAASRSSSAAASTPRSILSEVGEVEEEEPEEHGSARSVDILSPGRLGLDESGTPDSSFARRVKRNDSLAQQRIDVAAKKATVGGAHSVLGSMGEGDDEED